jgi:hypothetical protein
VAHQIPIKAEDKEDQKHFNENKSYLKVNAAELEQELAKNKKLISMTSGDEGNSSGSESEPSADNLDEEEMA